MSLPPHREKDAKVEGRDPPEAVKETMAPFRRLMRSLLNVPMSEVSEQQQLYEAQEAIGADGKRKRKVKRSLLGASSKTNKKYSDASCKSG